MSPRTSTCHFGAMSKTRSRLHAYLQEVGIRAERAVRTAQLRIERAAEQRLAEILARHQRETDARDQQRLDVGAVRGDEFRFGVQELDVGHALPVVAEPRPAHVREARDEVDGAVVDVAFALVFAGELQLEFLGGRIADGHDVARVDRLRGRGGLRFRAEPVAALVHAPVFPRDRAAHLGVGAVADAVLSTGAAVRFRRRC